MIAAPKLNNISHPIALPRVGNINNRIVAATIDNPQRLIDGPQYACIYILVAKRQKSPSSNAAILKRMHMSIRIYSRSTPRNARFLLQLNNHSLKNKRIIMRTWQIVISGPFPTKKQRLPQSERINATRHGTRSHQIYIAAIATAYNQILDTYCLARKPNKREKIVHLSLIRQYKREAV